ncbi:DUF4352 domain-containing protein [Streptomyces sp. NBC_01525]|uniref:DUF4352 domain-containing protein n=1 Tax=Streptomyces benahoarensis TaxID=2595054 RepID=A0A553ZKA2_9ACTN|nr:DUF4352 domain-containing protein [Streptomyces benahoarensis]TSB24540.1 DUF4352 domain-containing protein [Streptomyces benahoarensis]TSB41860.1 DUF4352 domain-containing protein [Streptomyces benahoarensis]
MRPSIRVATLIAGALLTAGLTTGCSSSGDDSKAPAASGKSPEAPSGDIAEQPAGKSGKTPVTIGDSGTYQAVDSASGARTQTSVTFKDVRAVQASEIKATKPPQHQYLVLTFTVKNTGDKDGAFHPQRLKWTDGQSPERSVATTEKSGSGQNLDATLHPGQSVTGDVVLDIPGAGGILRYYDGSGPVSLSFEVPAD